jgi:hypothetical protein
MPVAIDHRGDSKKKTSSSEFVAHNFVTGVFEFCYLPAT